MIKKSVKIVLAICFGLISITAQEAEYIVKSAFIEKFCRFTEWPEEKIESATEFKIVVLGRSSYEGILEEVFNGSQLKNKDVVIEYCNNLQDIKTIPEVIIISENRSRYINEIVNYAVENNVLTIGDKDGFCQRGVHINFYLTEDETLHFTINLESVKNAGLRISLMLIEIAKII